MFADRERGCSVQNLVVLILFLSMSNRLIPILARAPLVQQPFHTFFVENGDGRFPRALSQCTSIVVRDKSNS